MQLASKTSNSAKAVVTMWSASTVTCRVSTSEAEEAASLQVGVGVCTSKEAFVQVGAQMVERLEGVSREEATQVDVQDDTNEEEDKIGVALRVAVEFTVEASPMEKMIANNCSAMIKNIALRLHTTKLTPEL